MKIISKLEARQLNLRHYFTGKPCSNQHISPRFVSSGHCISCAQVQRKKWAENNPERLKELMSNWVSENPDKVKKKYKKWYDSHKEEQALRCRKYRADNPSVIKDWKKKNAHKIKEDTAKRRALTSSDSVEAVDYKILWVVSLGICYLCKEFMTKGKEHYDHVIPLSRGGSHTYDNIKPTHAFCNLSKGNKTLEELRK